MLNLSQYRNFPDSNPLYSRQFYGKNEKRPKHLFSEQKWNPQKTRPEPGVLTIPTKKRQTAANPVGNLWYIPTKMLDRATLEYYQENAPEVVQRHLKVKEGIEKYFPEAFPWKSGKILDIGCGSGRDLVALLASGFDAFGLEPSSAMRSEAIQRFPQLENRIFPFGLPFPANLNIGQPFDGLLCSAVLMHIPESALQPAIESLSLLLRKGGRSLVSVPGDRNDVGNDDRDSFGRLFKRYSKEFLETLFSRTGFILCKSFVNSDSLERKFLWLSLIFQKR